MLKYTKSTERPKVELVHITKTGGSALEAAAADADIKWGVCHYANYENVHCNKITDREAYGATWHIPPHFSKLTIKDLDAETICIVNEFYRMDFEKFGYNMMHEDHCKEKSPYTHDEVLGNNDNDIDSILIRMQA